MTTKSSVLHALVSPFLFVLLLTACGGGGGSSGTPPIVVDITPPTAVVTPETNLGIREAIVITFSEAMDPETLALDGDLAGYSDGGMWSDDDTVLTVSPDGAWESGLKSLSVDASDANGNAMATSDTDFEIRLVFETFQAASVVIGQPDFASDELYQGGTAPSSNTVNHPYDIAYAPDTGILYVADAGNNRILGFDSIPTTNNADADFVIGQVDFVETIGGTSATKLDAPYYLEAANGVLIVTSYPNHRAAIFDPAPEGAGASISTVVGQEDKTSTATGCTAALSDGPEDAVLTPDGKLLVQDWTNARVLVWNSLPDTDGAAADLVIGQADFTSCDNNRGGAAAANTLAGNGGMWSDGEKLVILDNENNRALIWNTFPTTNGQAADIVLGQSDFTYTAVNDDDQDGTPDAAPTARTMSPYFGVWSNGLQLFIFDPENNRILIWNSFPTENFAPADVVLGQSDFAHFSVNDDDQDGSLDLQPSARTFRQSTTGLEVGRDKLMVVDGYNQRVLIFESQ